MWGHAGNLAVQVFFALSGWLIGGILLNTSKDQLPRFYYNRATRIWIPYAIAVAALYAASALKETTTASHLKFLFFDLTFTHNWFIDVRPDVIANMPLQGTGNHFWSISVEEQFYLAAPLLLVLVPGSIAIWSAVALIAVATASWYGAISLGVLAALLNQRFGDWHLSASRIIAAGCAILAVVIVLVPASYDYACAPLAVSIVLLLARRGPRSQIGEFFGGVSYPLYLYHWTGMFVANAVLGHAEVLATSLVAFGVAVGAGAAAYIVVDRNVMRFRGSLYTPSLGKTLMIMAYGLLGVGIIGWIMLP